MNEEKKCCEGSVQEKTCVGKCGSHHGVLGIVAILAVVAFLVVCVLVMTTNVFTKNLDTISVTGQGRVDVRPDGALLDLGVITLSAKTPEEAISNTAKKIDEVSKALIVAGIPEANQSITGYVLNPIYSTGEMGVSNDTIIKGYTSSQQITVRIPDNAKIKSRVDEIVGVATKAGANQVGEIKFITSNIEKLKQEALLKAIVDAKVKADEMSKVAGLKIGKMTGWYEDAVALPLQGYKDPVASSGETASYNSAPSGYTILEPGQLEVIMQVTVSYRI